LTVKYASILQRFLREPLLHFIALGGLFFLLYMALNDFRQNASHTIVITPEQTRQLATEFRRVWNRMPTGEELDKLIQEEIRLEVYYRDAVALGLDKNDAVVRRRMRQKIEFLTDTGIYLQQPTAGELETYFAANEQAYRSEPRLAFEQIYLGESPPAHIVSQTLKRLLSEPAIDPATLGQRSLLPAQLKLSPPVAIDGVFGQGFYQRIAELAPGKWGGPVISDYGVHLVRTLDGRPARLPALEEVRETVLKDWRSAKAKKNRERDYAKRRGRYRVEILSDDSAGGDAEKERR